MLGLLYGTWRKANVSLSTLAVGSLPSSYLQGSRAREDNGVRQRRWAPVRGGQQTGPIRPRLLPASLLARDAPLRPTSHSLLQRLAQDLELLGGAQVPEAGHAWGTERDGSGGEAQLVRGAGRPLRLGAYAPMPFAMRAIASLGLSTSASRHPDSNVRVYQELTKLEEEDLSRDLPAAPHVPAVQRLRELGAPARQDMWEKRQDM